ncbi:MAG TPA: response regulator transcription factor [Solirubrobacteraceae bacterium]|nr:response regulator transcription factor [Solirubrobacteraceae bacterium]
MIRILVVDDHPAVRAGLDAVLGSEVDLVAVGAACSSVDLSPLLYRTRPDVVLLDYHLPRDDGLRVCVKIKAELPPPRVVMYSAYADASLTVPAMLAGVDGIVHKGAPAHELVEAVRQVARGETVLPPLSPDLLTTAGRRLDTDDLPILAMLVDSTPRADVAAVLGLEPRELGARINTMIGRLKTEVPVAAPRVLRA